MRIGQKLVLGFSAVALLVGVVGIIGILHNKSSQNIAEKEVYRSISHLDDVWQLMEAQEHQEIAANNYLFLDAGLQERRADYFYEKERLQEIYQRYNREACEHIRPLVQEYYENIKRFHAEMEEAFELHRQGADLEFIKESIREANKYAETAHEDALEPIIEHVYKEHIEPAKESIAKGISRTTNATIIISVIAVFLAISLGLFISRSIYVPLAKLKAGTAEMGKGKLDTKIKIASNDKVGELATSFNDMAVKLNESHANLEKKVQKRTAELSSANVKLEEEISERTQAQKKLQRHINQLDCLYGLSKLVERPKISLEQIFQETADLVRNAHQHPDLTCVRITFNGIHYETDNFQKTEASQHAEIKVRAEKAGDIEVYYLGPETGQNPFLKEERDLLDAVAEHLGRIAERTQAREKLRLFRDLIDRSNDCIFVIEPKWGRFADVNQKASDSLGYTREELLDMTVKDIEQTIPDDSAWSEHATQVQKKGYMVSEGQHKRKDGTTFPVETNVKFIGQNGNSYMLAVARDITERKQAEEALWESQERYRALVENTALGITIMDANYNIIMTNATFCKLFKKSASEFVGKNCFREYEKREEVCPHCPGRRAMASGATAEVETQAVLDDGTRIHVRNRAIPFFGPDGEVKGFIEIVENIDERKKAEERQAELLQQVESANRELKDFAHIVSHDLKAPLHGIKILTEWMSTDYADKLDEQGKEQMNLLSNRADRMHNLIDGVLEYSRVGRVKGKMVQVNLNELVPAVIDTLAPPKNITITAESQLPTVEYEETRIIQVFQNLLSNAVKYMDKPKGQIKVGCVEEDSFWKFSVADNGPGIEEKDFERIFKIFQTLAPRDEVESTGVGLTVVKKIIELYGGKIWVQSKVKEGTTFFFTLPKQKKEMGVKDAKLEEANIACGR